VWDLFLPKPYKDGGRPVDEWNIFGLKTAICVHGTLNNPADSDTGWTIEIAIPWNALFKATHTFAPPKNGDQWRINFSRVEWKHDIIEGRYRKIPDLPEDNWVWSPQGVIDMHRPEHWGFIQFSTEKVGQGSVRPDLLADARAILHWIYYEQKKYHQKHQSWARSLNALAGDLSVFSQNNKTIPSITLTPNGYIASVSITFADGSSSWVHIRQDSYFWVEAIK
jgi:hypothetical protein